METPTIPEATPPENETHKEPETRECVTLEEYQKKCRNYREIAQVNAIDQRKIYEHNLVFLKDKIPASRIQFLDTMIASNKVYRCTGTYKKSVLIPDIDMPTTHQVSWQKSKKLENFQNGYVQLFLDPTDVGTPGTLMITVPGKLTFNLPEFAVAGGPQYKKSYPIGDLEESYVYTKMSIQFMHKHNLTRLINYDLPTKPLPPRSLDAHTRISLITKLDADVLQAQLTDSLSFSIPYLFQATKSTHITQKGKEDVLLIGNEKVSHTEFTLYEKYKKDHMIAQGHKNELQAQPDTPISYWDLSRSHFRQNIFNKDPNYTAEK